MGLSQITLTSYDTVVAVTQDTINEMLAVFLSTLQKQVALYYTVDNNGNYVPTTPENAVYIFTGTLDYTLDANGNPVNMVVLNSQIGPQTVLYNITFSNAEFKSTVAPTFDITQQGGSPWIISFQVNLSQVSAALSNLPASAQATIQKATTGLDPNIFSIQQLYIDLNTAVFDSLQNINGMNTFAESIFQGIMRSYLASLQAQKGIVFGYSVVAAGLNTALVPTFMPTALDFCVSSYTDANGQHSDPQADTLNYLLMVSGRALPPQPPDGFPFNFVDVDSNDIPLEQGAMAIRSGLYVGFLINQLSPILQSISPVAYVKANGNETVYDQTMQLNAGVSHTFTPVNPPQDGVVANFSYASPQASDNTSFVGGTCSVTLTYSSTCSVSLSGPLVTIAGSSVVSAQTDSSVMGSVFDVIMPPTTYAWSVDLLLEMDPSNNGQLNYAIQNANFSSPPTVAPEHQSAWDKFFSSVGGAFQQFVDDPGDIRGTVQSQVMNSIQPALVAAIQGANNFVFPGGGTFLFKDTTFTATDNLAADITYQTPAAAEPASV